MLGLSVRDPKRSANTAWLAVGLAACAACASPSASRSSTAAARSAVDQTAYEDAGVPPEPPTPPPIAATIEHFDPEASARARSGEFLECGKRYLEVFHADPTGANAALALRNSMDCYRAGNAVGAAITSARLLIARFPRSKYAGPALLSIAELSSAIAYFGPAASAYEDYARKHPKEEIARRGLLRAIRLRRGLGRHEKAIADAERFWALYRGSHPDEAARVALDAIASFDARGDEKGLAEHLEAYLAEIGNRAGVDRAIVARSRLGLALWRLSCPVPTIRGLCAKVAAPAEPAPARCAADLPPALVPVARDAALAGRAETHFRAVIDEMWQGGAPANDLHGEDRDARLEQMIDAVARAKLYLAEPAYEAFLALPPPAEMSAAPSQPRALRALASWLRSTDKELRRAVDAFDRAMKLEGWAPHWPIAAAARTGDLYLHVAQTVLSAPLPPYLTAPGAEARTERYCAALQSRVDKYQGEAERAFELCHTEGIRRKRYHTGAQRCTDELVRLRPDRFPPVLELHGAPNRTGVRADEYKLGRKVWSHRLAKDSSSVDAHYNLAWIAYDELGAATDPAKRRELRAEARSHLAAALAIDHDHVASWLLYALLHLRIARDDPDERDRQLDLAELLSREALERDPDSALSWNALGLVEIERDRPGRAARMFARAVTADHKLTVAWLNAGDLALDNRDFEGARDAFHALLLLKPGSYEGRIGQGVALRALGDFEGAEEAYLTAEKYTPKDARGEALFDLGLLEAEFLAPAEKDPSAAIGRYRTARDYFKRSSRGRNMSPAEKRSATQWVATCDERIQALAAP